MRISAEERRKKILDILNNASEAISGSKLAKELGVSRQVVVTDITVLRQIHPDIIATNAGYILMRKQAIQRIFKVQHNDEEILDELLTIVGYGGCVKDVFIEHKVYGTISAPLNISTINDIDNFIADLNSGVSTPLKNITHGYHYHTVEAKSEDILDKIEQELKKKNYLIEALDNTQVYQPKQYNQ